MLRRFWALVSSAAVVLLTRWGLRVAKPADDIQAVRVLWWEFSERVHDLLLTFWRAYGPVTGEMRAKWAELRNLYRQGSYGLEGT